MRQVPGREPDGFAPRSLRPGPFMPVFFVPQSFSDQAPDAPGP